MSLEFLSTRPTAPTPARSPLLDAALAAGAETEVRDGWEVVSSFGAAAAEARACAETVGFADRSELTKLERQLPAGSTPAAFAGGTATRLADGWRCPVRPNRELVLAEPGTDAGAGIDPDEEARICDLTGSLAAIAIAGPLARETFARFSALDLREAVLPVAGFRPGSVARTAGFVLREAPDRFLMLFGAAYGQYAWEVVADAAEKLGGRPVGVDSLPGIATEAEAAGA